MWAAFIALLTSGLTYAKVGLALLNIAQSLIAKADRRELRDEGYQAALADTTAKTLKVVGITAAAFGRVAGWTDDQVIDDLTKPPQPRSR